MNKKSKDGNPPVKRDTNGAGYQSWIAELKRKIHAARQRAMAAVNHELVALYWEIGHEILTRQERQGWGAKVITRLAQDLRAEFPEMKGFSRTNLLYMRAFAETWSRDEIVQQPVGQLPWGHVLVLMNSFDDKTQMQAYAAAAVEYGWSRNVLVHHIESETLAREGQAQTNFTRTLPAPQSELALQSLKDPYKLEFLGLGKEAKERDIENALVSRMTEFLLELGAGFAYVGRQYHIEVGGQDYYIDLLFYNIRLRCYFVVELKAGEFEPEFVGKLGFYIAAVDNQLRQPGDGQTIGLLLCKKKNRIVAEYALQNDKRPIGVSEYKLVKTLDRSVKGTLPSVRTIETELNQ